MGDLEKAKRRLNQRLFHLTNLSFVGGRKPVMKVCGSAPIDTKKSRT
jgi:hypothetical protein